MALKTKKAVISNKKSVGTKINPDEVIQITTRLVEIDESIARLRDERISLYEKKLNLELFPFKIGGYCVTEISSGRSKKMQKCLIECESGIIYVRPIKDDGSLSGRHFSICPVGTTYHDILKPVEE